MTLAEQISKDRGQPATVRVGTVGHVEPLVVHVQGTDFVNVGVLANYVPVVGQSVVLLGQSAVSADGSSWLALGSPTSSITAGAPSTDGIQVMAAAQINTTAVYANMTGVTFQFTKRRNESRILAHMAGSAFSSNVGNAAEFGAQIIDNTGVLVATDNTLASFFFNTAATHHSWSGFRYLTGVPAGDYTIQGRFRLYIIVAGSVQLDGNDRISLGFTEVD